MRAVKTLRPLLVCWLAALLLANAACKVRDSDAGGLLDANADADADPAVAAGAGLRDDVAATGPQGAWLVVCQALAEPRKGQAKTVYRLAVRGAIDPRDEAQPLVVSVSRAVGPEQAAVVDGARGRGAIVAGGAVFVGFESGALTAEPADADRAPATHVGILTLASDPDANGLNVACTVTKGA